MSNLTGWLRVFHPLFLAPRPTQSYAVNRTAVNEKRSQSLYYIKTTVMILNLQKHFRDV
jgi:hypothetical protein